MIEFKNVSFTYDGYSTACIEDISFKIDKGQVVLLTGLSGSGKSTLLKCINGLIPNLYEGKLEGQIFLKGQNMSDLSMSQINHQIGSVFQNPRSQFFTTCPLSELAFAMENYGMDPEKIKDRMARLSQQFYLAGILHQDIFKISSGERQRLSLACAFSLEPKILIFDEPSSNLDYGMTLQIGQYIKQFKELGYTILVADHRYFYLENLLDKVIVLEKGRLSGIYTETEFKNSDYPLRPFSLFGQTYPLLEYEPQDICLSLSRVSYRHILKDITLKARKGEVLAILGKNGAGKTTLAKLICQMEKPDAGSITSPTTMFVMQDSDYQLFGTSVENELTISPNPVTMEEINQALHLLGLEKLSHRHPFSLSGGEKQRLQIATAAVSKAELVIFDEPTSGLDLHRMNEVSHLILGLAKDRVAIIISHDYEFIRKTAHRIVYLNKGKIEDDFTINPTSQAKIEAIFDQMKGGLL